MPKAWLSLTAGVLVLACADAKPSAQNATRTDSAGVELVSNSASDLSLNWTFERLLTLGGADVGPESFYQVSTSGLAFDVRGRIYVLDAGNLRVQVFSEAGEYIRTIGREGEGPGEFRGPSSLVIDPSGTLTVHDFPARAIMRFDSSGIYLDQHPAAPGIFGRVGMDGDAYLFATRSRAPEVDGMVFNLYRASGADTAQLARIPLPSVRSIQYASCGVMGISLPALFDKEPTWDTRGGRLILREGSEYSIRVFEDGREVRHVRRSLEPETATPELAAVEVGEGEQWLIGGAPCTVPPEELVASRGIAERVPLVATITIAPDGWMWVRREAIGRPGPVDIFDATGQYIGTLPPDAPWPAAFGPGEQILALESDDLSIQHVVVYRVRRE
jgi:hypothetical protein